MPFIRRNEPDMLAAYLTAPISATAIQKFREKFSLGSQERWVPLVKLDLDETRTDMYGKSPEQVMATLETEKGPETTFLVLDRGTEVNGTVWLCRGWASKDNFGAEEVRRRLPFLQRVRVTAVCAPDVYVNVDIGNISIPELGGVYLGDPAAPDKIEEFGMIDVVHKKPRAAHVCAFPGEYEVSRDPELDAGVAGLPAGYSVVRLTEDAASKLGLVQGWAIGEKAPQDGEGVMAFTAEWAWSPGE